jgi:hypothetical protein
MMGEGEGPDTHLDAATATRHGRQHREQRLRCAA